jgi:hypothetical protein
LKKKRGDGKVSNGTDDCYPQTSNSEETMKKEDVNGVRRSSFSKGAKQQEGEKGQKLIE